MAILFDLDGTLIDTTGLYREAYRRAVAPYVRADLSPAELRTAAPRSEMRFLEHVVRPDALDETREAFYVHYEALHDDFFGGPYPGVAETLEALRRRRNPLGIVTGKSRRSWEITAASLSLGPFDVLVFEDDVAAPKPDPEGIRIALDTLDAPPDDSVYVGDAIDDVRAAASAGVRPIAALWAKADDERDGFAHQAGHAGADVIERPDALLDLLDD